MKERVYYRLSLELQSALSIGAADSVQTDNDVILDSRGLPLLPATSLAGLYRSFFDESRAIEVFGEVLETERSRILGTKDPSFGQSAVRVYDGTWIGGNDAVAVRDSVSLKDRVAVDKLKFDRQAVQSGARFVTYIEILDTNRCSMDAIEEVISALDSGALRLGSKSTRGFGRFNVTSCLRRAFDATDVDEWLDFNMFAPQDSPSWTPADDITALIHESLPSGDVEIRLSLDLVGGISIREYTTEPNDLDVAEQDIKPDFVQLTVHGSSAKDANGQDEPVVPGTSWAGAFRDRYASYAGDAQVAELFGYVSQRGGQNSSLKSRIVFDESVIQQGEWKNITRTAIDRLTGGVMEGALYTERTYYGGNAELSIRIAQPDLFDESSFVPLVATLADLHNGFLPIGGLASVGRGLFKIRDAQLMRCGERILGFSEALLAKASLGSDLIAPNVSLVASMLCGKAGDPQ